ncbi:MAG: response regulator [Verrucomicrobiota bacterium]
MSHKNKVFVVDDHPMICRGLRDFLNEQENLVFCGEANNLTNALAMIPKIQPDILILDLSIGNRSGLELIKELKSKGELPLTLVLSIYDELIYAERCVKIGARGYMMKTRPIEEILEAIQKMLQGEMAISPSAATHMIKRMSHEQEQSKKIPTTDEEIAAMLSDRELHVFELIGQGHSVKKNRGYSSFKRQNCGDLSDAYFAKTRCS